MDTIRALLALFVALAAPLTTSLVGLTMFRRGWARRALRFARRPDPELAFGSFPAAFVRTMAFAWRHPRALRSGLVYALHLLVGIDPLAALDDRTLERVHAALERRVGDS